MRIPLQNKSALPTPGQPLPGGISLIRNVQKAKVHDHEKTTLCSGGNFWRSRFMTACGGDSGSDPTENTAAETTGPAAAAPVETEEPSAFALMVRTVKAYEVIE